MITPPASEPLSLEEVKAHIRVTHDHEDTLITEIINAARHHTEFASGEKFITQAWRQYESCLPQDRTISLRLRPVQSIQTVTVFDRAGQPMVLADIDYSLLRTSEGQCVVFADHVALESAANGVELDLIVGMGDLGIDVPPVLKRAILLLVAHWYEFRGAISPSDQPVSMPSGYDALLAPYRSVRLA